MKDVKAKCKIWKLKQTKTLLIQCQLLTFCKPACLQKYFHSRALSIRVFSLDGHYGLIVSLRGWTLPRHVINLNQYESEKIQRWTITIFIPEETWGTIDGSLHEGHVHRSVRALRLLSLRHTPPYWKSVDFNGNFTIHKIIPPYITFFSRWWIGLTR